MKLQEFGEHLLRLIATAASIQKIVTAFRSGLFWAPLLSSGVACLLIFLMWVFKRGETSRVSTVKKFFFISVVCVIILQREYAGKGLGIILAGGADYETKTITVENVLTGSIADRGGQVYRGDTVFSINGKSTKGLTQQTALNHLKAPRTEEVLVVSCGRSEANGFQTFEEANVTLDRAVEPLLNGSLSCLLENDKDSGFKWGSARTNL